jgi:hypothetical protein
LTSEKVPYRRFSQTWGWDPYRRHCLNLLDRFAASSNPIDAERAAKTCLLSSRPVGDRGRLDRLVAVAAPPDHPASGWARALAGLADYRGGRPGRAVHRLREGRWRDDELGLYARLVLAMAEQRAGDAARARRLLADASAALRSQRTQIAGNSWHDWLVCELLRREAEATILEDPIFPADPFAPDG